CKLESQTWAISEELGEEFPNQRRSSRASVQAISEEKKEKILAEITEDPTPRRLLRATSALQRNLSPLPATPITGLAFGSYEIGFSNWGLQKRRRMACLVAEVEAHCEGFGLVLDSDPVSKTTERSMEVAGA
ncbi:hypothetical protein U1Q18_044026, partial [Sarracenia purpurea var. burkii]